jgi:hypothetical protein
VRTLVELNAGPSEHLLDVLLGPLDEPRAIGVLDAQHHRAAVVPGEEVVVESGAKASDMEKSGRRRSKSYANHGSYQSDGNERQRYAERKSAAPLTTDCAFFLDDL